MRLWGAASVSQSNRFNLILLLKHCFILQNVQEVSDLKARIDELEEEVRVLRLSQAQPSDY